MRCKGMGQAHLRYLIAAELLHIRIAVRNVSQMPHAKRPPDIMQKSQHIRFFRIHVRTRGCDFFRAVRRRFGVVAPRSRIFLQSLLQQLFCFFSRWNHKLLPRFLSWTVFIKNRMCSAHSRAEARLLRQPSTLAPSAHPRGAFFII